MGYAAAMPSFVAIDFETANNARDSACSIAAVVVEHGQIARTLYHLIQPPSRAFQFTYIHGIRWEDVADAPDFAAVWAELEPVIRAAPFLAAHNAAFDRSVLDACCRRHSITVPRKRYLCTVAMAREVWNLHPTKLPDVCRHLGLALKHHDAVSDAQACANIVLAAARQGHDVRRWV
jgi:DNA polymerase-3 subunit epsilon